MQQVSSKVVTWKTNILSFAGQVTLVKSIIEAIPIYPMMTDVILKACIEEIHQMQRNFIWGDTVNKKRIHAIKWDTLQRPKKLGGLGLRNLEVMNKACLMKLNWNFPNNSKDLWCKVLKGLYGEVTMLNVPCSRSNDSSLWKALCRVTKPMLSIGFWSVV